MKIRRLQLSGFTVFEQATFEFAPGINVLMGENGTGKSQVLRVLYAFAADEPEPKRFGARLLGTLQARRGKELWRGRHAPSVSVETDERKNSIDVTTEEGFWPGRFYGRPPRNVVLMPANETLSLFPGFEELYHFRELEWPTTIIDLQQQLRVPPLREKELPSVVNRLTGIVGGRVKLERDRFVLEENGKRTPAPMMAEGHRKLGMLAALVENGVVGPGKLLLWDEPEANLHPALTEIVVDVLLDLARHGAQVVLATHSYLVARLCSRAAEDTPEDPSIRFFSLHRPNRTVGVAVETGSVLAEIQHDAILDAFSRYDQQEMDRALRRVTSPPVGPTKKRITKKRTRRKA